ncbi:flagellar basal body-associated FliL family protein [Thermodesulforhabdus norvegica]|uniref:Flagellar protein FliL n=1 Tax=Thermodesulforhabdus norvegica TaxID=39841 RepID=A0A1I4R5I8_9BACT|nr:flagellar basal body-associated FliL family protein [Thermodesulforhabdus norvegica]SFM47578.1 flagellar FliL protein [Thermodesulforhabdus norvegica]
MAETEETRDEKKKGSKLKLIILVVLILILGGGGFFAYKKFFASSKDEESTPDKAPQLQQVITHQLDTFLVNLADPGGKRYLKLTIDLELDNPKVIEEITQNNYKIRDTILLILSSKEFDDISTVGGKLALKKEIMTKLNSILTTGRVLNIYFTEFLVQ